MDYPKSDFLVFSIIVNVDNNTTSDIVEGNWRRKVKIGKWECVIFTGGFMHAGSSYSVSNRHLFFKAIPINRNYQKLLIIL